MGNFFLLVFLLSSILLVVGLIKPNIYSRFLKQNLSRKKLFFIFTAIALTSFVLFALTTDLSTENQIKKEDIKKSEPTTKPDDKALGSSADSVEENESQDTKVKVTKVIDGDTLKIETGEAIRLIGIDSPEKVHPSEPIQCYAKEASEKAKELLEGKKVLLEKDISETDKYGRLLRYVWIDDLLVNNYLVREGFAQSSSYPPDVKYQDKFIESQREAKEEGKGLWGSACDNWEEITPVPKNYTTDTQRAPAIPQPGESWSCDCSKACSQMSSCDEAYYQLTQCGCFKRDGDKDGVPCEGICS